MTVIGRAVGSCVTMYRRNRWPSGATELVKNLPADQHYSILEGKGVVTAEEIRPKSHNNK